MTNGKVHMFNDSTRGCYSLERWHKFSSPVSDCNTRQFRIFKNADIV